MSKNESSADMQSVMSQANKGMKRSATAANVRMNAVHSAWFRQDSNKTGKLIPRIGIDARVSLAHSRVTFQESRINGQGDQNSRIVFQGRAISEKRSLRKNLQVRIDKIRENCNQVMELDTDAMLTSNEAMGWSLPQGFLQYAEIKDIEHAQQIILPADLN